MSEFVLDEAEGTGSDADNTSCDVASDAPSKDLEDDILGVHRCLIVRTLKPQCFIDLVDQMRQRLRPS